MRLRKAKNETIYVADIRQGVKILAHGCDRIRGTGMQINRNMSAVMTNNQLLRTENKLAASMERLSSGLKINQASDNPAGIAISNKMKAQIDALDQAESNASDAVSVLQIADGALNEVSSILQRMRELSVQAANGTNSYSDRQSIQAEIDELKKEVDRISSDTEYNTKALLDGSSDVRVYGKNASRYMVSDSVPAQVYSMNVNAAAQQATVELDYKVPAEEGRITINGVVVNVSSGMSEDMYIQELRNAATEAGCYVEIQEEDLANNIEKKILVKSNYYGTDESIEFSISKELAEDIGVEDNADATYVVNEASMTFDANTAVVVGHISIDGVNVEIDDDTKVLGDYFDAIIAAAEKAGHLASVDANGNLVVNSKSAGKAEMIQFSVSEDLANGLNIIDNFAGEYQVNTRGVDADVTIPSSDTDPAVRADTGFTSTTTVDVNGNRVLITDNNGFSIDFLLNEGFFDTTNPFEIEVTDIGSMTIQIGGNEHQDMDVRITEVSSASLYVDTVDVSVVKGADRAMVTLDGAISTLSATRSRIGAFQNRLEYAVSSLASTNENMTSAYSGLLDTDMAEEMTEYTQQNILSQAAISVLSQANELPQQVLSLLQ